MRTNRNKLLMRLTEERTELLVEIGQTGSSTIASLAMQLASSDGGGQAIKPEDVRQWARELC